MKPHFTPASNAIQICGILTLCRPGASLRYVAFQEFNKKSVTNQPALTNFLGVWFSCKIKILRGKVRFVDIFEDNAVVAGLDPDIIAMR